MQDPAALRSGAIPGTRGTPTPEDHADSDTRRLTIEVNPFGQPIPGLCGAGELGEAVGMLYPANGGNLSESLCFGRLAAEHALAQALPRRPLLPQSGPPSPARRPRPNRRLWIFTAPRGAVSIHGKSIMKGRTDC